jgi:hypothetical protein
VEAGSCSLGADFLSFSFSGSALFISLGTKRTALSRPTTETARLRMYSYIYRA